MSWAFGRSALLRTSLLTASLLLAGPRLALAQDSQAENVAAARSLGIQGVQLAEAGKCVEAIEKLSRAEALYHAPTILGRLGECQVNVGQIVLGTENLNRVVREQLPANAPAAFRDAQDRARKVLGPALARIGHLTVEVEPKEADATVTVSGAPVPKALFGMERPTDPGTHEVVASAPGYIAAKTSVDLAEGGKQAVTLRLTPDPNAAVAPVAVAATTPPPADKPPPQAEHRGGNKALAIVLISVGGAGVITGIVTGALALTQKGTLDCPDHQCSGSDADDLDSANTKATVSTVSFAIGISAAAVGTVLLVMGSSGSDKSSGKHTPPKHFAATPYVGVGNAGVAGTFW